jgi:hypothetical protein
MRARRSREDGSAVIAALAHGAVICARDNNATVAAALLIAVARRRGLTLEGVGR